MTTGLGVGVGSANSAAALDGGTARVVVTHPSTLALSGDSAPVLGAERVGARVLVDGFVERVGDPIGILADDGSIYRGEDLTATAIGCLVDEAARTTRDEPTIVAAYPASWPHYTVDALREALERAGFGDVTPVPEPTAAVAWLAGTRGPLADGAVVVYDLGASKLDVTVVRTGDETGIIGQPVHSEDISGAQFDHLTVQHVLASTVDVGALDVFDPATEVALTELRVRAARAKEQLSSDTETVLAVELGGKRTEVRLVRDEVEDLFREPLLASIELVREAVRIAGLELGDVSQVLLVGGGASIPLVAELVSSQLGLPVVASADPGHTTVLGAAMLARELGAAAAALAEPIAAAAVPASVAAAVSAPRPAPVVPSAPVAEPASRWRRPAIIGASIVAIALLVGGGLALGAGSSDESGTPSTPAQSTSAEVTTATAPTQSSAAAASTTTAESAESSNAAASSQAGSAPTQPNNGQQPVQQSAAPAVTPQNEEPAPAEPQTTNPAPVTTQPQQTVAPQPSYHSNPTGPTNPNPYPDFSNESPAIPILPSGLPIVG